MRMLILLIGMVRSFCLILRITEDAKKVIEHLSGLIETTDKYFPLREDILFDISVAEAWLSNWQKSLDYFDILKNEFPDGRIKEANIQEEIQILKSKITIP